MNRVELIGVVTNDACGAGFRARSGLHMYLGLDALRVEIWK